MKKECEMCNGSGQINFFQGVSRFLLTVEECPECGGLGYHINPTDESTKDQPSKTGRENKGQD